METVCFDDTEKIELCHLLHDVSFYRRKYGTTKQKDILYLQSIFSGSARITGDPESPIIELEDEK